MSTITHPPEHTLDQRKLDQRKRAIRRANEIRIARAALKRELKAGARSPLPLLMEPPAYVEGMKTCDVLGALPKFSTGRALNLMNRKGISPTKTVAGLTPRQREALQQALSGRTQR